MDRTDIKGNAKRARILRRAFLPAIILLVYILLVTSPIDALAGCSGDCFSCHPNINNDITHKSLGSCYKCHKPLTDNFKLQGGASDGCGERCFDCHNEWPDNAHHADLNQCSNCHTGKYEKPSTLSTYGIKFK